MKNVLCKRAPKARDYYYTEVYDDKKRKEEKKEKKLQLTPRQKTRTKKRQSLIKASRGIYLTEYLHAHITNSYNSSYSYYDYGPDEPKEQAFSIHVV